jgi:hypothetical protein
MPQFNLNDYETVEQRLRRAHAEHEDLRVVTVNHTTEWDREKHTWVVEARIYLGAGDQANDLPKATGWAFEIDGVGMSQKTAALETAETSAIGRALANMNLSGNKRASREEMEKAQRGQGPRDWAAEADKLETVKELRVLWAQAKQGGADKKVLAQLEAKANELGNSGGVSA